MDDRTFALEIIVSSHGFFFSIGRFAIFCVVHFLHDFLRNSISPQKHAKCVNQQLIDIVFFTRCIIVDCVPRENRESHFSSHLLEKRNFSS